MLGLVMGLRNGFLLVILCLICVNNIIRVVKVSIIKISMIVVCFNDVFGFLGLGFLGFWDLE